MAHVILSASKVLLFMASFYGWGSLVYRWFGGYRLSVWAFPSALGIAFLIAVGGILNALGIAKPMVLLTLFVVGLIMAIFFAYSSFHDNRKNISETSQLAVKPSWYTVGNLAYFALILLVFFYLVMVLMPARSFNYHDDFHVYFMWPFRMLHTGSLGGNPFDHIGVSSLGGQSFIHGMFLTLGNIADVNAFDAIICLILTLGLLKELGKLIGANAAFTLVAGLLAIFINPHYANISSLYSGSLMLLGLTYATALLARPNKSSTSTGLILSVVPSALFFAALLTLKTTYIFVVAFFWIVAFLVSLSLAKEWKQVLLTYLSCAAITTLLLIPWVSIYFDRYLRKIYFIFNDIGYVQGTTTSSEVPDGVLTTLLSNNELYYGNTYRDYLSIVVLLLIASVATGWIIWKNRSKQEFYLLAPFLALFLSAIISYGLQFIFGPARLVVRYSCPFLIGAAPATVLLAGWFWAQGSNHLQAYSAPKKVALFISSILFISQLGLVWTFSQTLVLRVKRTYYHRTPLQYIGAENKQYKQYNDYVLSTQAKKRMVHIQDAVPADETIFAWVAMPMHFNFDRNSIYTTNESGLAYNLLVMPLEDGTEEIRKYFQEFGIRYIIWDYNSYGMKKRHQFGTLQIKLVAILEELIFKSKVLYDDGEAIVLDIDS